MTVSRIIFWIFLFIFSSVGEHVQYDQEIEWSLTIDGVQINDFKVITSTNRLTTELDSSRITLELVSAKDTIRLKGIPAYGLFYSDCIVIEIDAIEEECALISVADDYLITVRPHTDVSQKCSFENKLTFRYRNKAETRLEE